ncbi:hypothetical protein JTE90_011168 [Oedothorax gibbosus]|uniref:Uncharacterized protein n=1 Tax=Oedothorax gibbosus TaxID=931172 RepID=A0AAV6U8S0_9ARAC|nr:hypothetical protein JTE90_011168 [Oedothorax gibbosus]
MKRKSFPLSLSDAHAQFVAAILINAKHCDFWLVNSMGLYYFEILLSSKCWIRGTSFSLCCSLSLQTSWYGLLEKYPNVFEIILSSEADIYNDWYTFELLEKG